MGSAARILPARELLGDLLLELGRPAEALSAYESSLVNDPRRLSATMAQPKPQLLPAMPIRLATISAESLK
jgi:predicted negative regulator of RcsB-dependent stress response